MTFSALLNEAQRDRSERGWLLLLLNENVVKFGGGAFVEWWTTLPRIVTPLSKVKIHIGCSHFAVSHYAN